MANIRQKPEVRTITIAIVRNRTEALEIQSKLKSEGIECVLAGERSFVVKKSGKKELGAVKVQVARGDVQRALDILRAKNSATPKHSPTRVDGSRILKLRAHRLATRESMSAVALVFLVLALLVLFIF